MAAPGLLIALVEAHSSQCKRDYHNGQGQDFVTRHHGHLLWYGRREAKRHRPLPAGGSCPPRGIMAYGGMPANRRFALVCLKPSLIPIWDREDAHKLTIQLQAQFSWAGDHSTPALQSMLPKLSDRRRVGKACKPRKKTCSQGRPHGRRLPQAASADDKKPLKLPPVPVSSRQF